jgi:hypothetical protein
MPGFFIGIPGASIRLCHATIFQANDIRNKIERLTAADGTSLALRTKN